MTGFTHEKASKEENDNWITPLSIIQAFGENYFDLDPCACIPQPWPCAKNSYNKGQNGLNYDWVGRVWCNPPYSRPAVILFLKRMLEHGNGIALIFARTETSLWQEYIFPTCKKILFIKGRLQFYLPSGVLPRDKSGNIGTPGAPSALISWGKECADKLEEVALEEKYQELYLINLDVVLDYLYNLLYLQ